MHSPREGDDGRQQECAAFSVCDDDMPTTRVDGRVRAILTSWQLRGVAETTSEIVGLLVTAATPHPRRRADVRLRTYDGVLRAEVSGSHLFPPGVPAGHAASRHTAEEESGVYGILPALLASRCARWGCDSSASGCTIWFELPAGASGTAAETLERPVRSSARCRDTAIRRYSRSTDLKPSIDLTGVPRATAP